MLLIVISGKENWLNTAAYKLWSSLHTDTNNCEPYLTKIASRVF